MVHLCCFLSLRAHLPSLPDDVQSLKKHCFIDFFVLFLYFLLVLSWSLLCFEQDGNTDSVASRWSK